MKPEALNGARTGDPTLDALNKVRSSICYSLAYDISTPIALVRKFCDILSDDLRELDSYMAALQQTMYKTPVSFRPPLDFGKLPAQVRSITDGQSEVAYVVAEQARKAIEKAGRDVGRSTIEELYEELRVNKEAADASIHRVSAGMNTLLGIPSVVQVRLADAFNGWVRTRAMAAADAMDEAITQASLGDAPGALESLSTAYAAFSVEAPANERSVEISFVDEYCGVSVEGSVAGPFEDVESASALTVVRPGFDTLVLPMPDCTRPELVSMYLDGGAVVFHGDRPAQLSFDKEVSWTSPADPRFIFWVDNVRYDVTLPTPTFDYSDLETLLEATGELAVTESMGVVTVATSTVGATLSVAATELTEDVLAMSDLYDSGAANDTLTLVYSREGGPDVVEATTFVGSMMPGAIAAQIEAMTTVVGSAEYAGDGCLHVYGFAKDGELSVDPSSSAVPVFEFSTRAVGHSLTVEDIRSAWTSVSPDVDVSENDDHLVLSVQPATSVSFSGDPVAILGLDAGDSVVVCNTVVASGAVVRSGDKLNDEYVLSTGPAGAWHVSSPLTTEGWYDISPRGEATIGTVLSNLRSYYGSEDWRVGATALWGLLWSEVGLADRSRSLTRLADTRSTIALMLSALDTLVVNNVAEVDAAFVTLNRYGLDLAAWYAGALQFDMFLNAPVAELSSSGRIAGSLADVLGLMRSDGRMVDG